jgi:spermidine synthase
MYKYDGLVIYQNHDDEGILEVVESNGVRSLHFGSTAKQSSIDINDPETLQLPYARTMSSWLLFKDKVDKAMVVGLGGGSLTRFLLYHFPECRVRAVEYRDSVVKIARSHFGLSLDSRLKVIVGDGGSYVRQQAQAGEGGYDIIFLDAFDVDGMAQSIASVAFFDACKMLLKSDGILAINLWGSESNLYSTCLEWLQDIFVDKVLILPVRKRGNVIVLAFNQAVGRYDFKTLQQKAKQLEEYYHIEFPLFLKDLNKHNPYTIHTVVTK